jgi:glycerol-3-phosphate acyltransferase PlsX
MTSERGVDVVAAAAAAAVKEIPDLAVELVGDPAVLQPQLSKVDGLGRLTLHPAGQVIGMDEEPGQAFRAKKDASVSVAMRLVKDGSAQAAVSPGNTGASTIAATLVLGRLEGVRKPAILFTVPHGHGHTCVLDGGAIVDGKPEDLLLSGIMGSLYVQEILGQANPRVGLLSIGEEEIKGNEQSLAAFPLLKQSGLNFIGNIEGRDLFKGHCEVAVCDGFVGNIVMKTAEGLASMINAEIEKSIRRGNFLVKLGGLLVKPAFADFKRRINKDEYGGAVLLGVDGICIISHGSANQTALKNALRLACNCVRQDLTRKLRGKIGLQLPTASN